MKFSFSLFLLLSFSRYTHYNSRGYNSLDLIQLLDFLDFLMNYILWTRYYIPECYGTKAGQNLEVVDKIGSIHSRAMARILLFKVARFPCCWWHHLPLPTLSLKESIHPFANNCSWAYDSDNACQVVSMCIYR